MSVTEDYCSFETAKLLKEKGFDEYCLKNYWSTDKELHNWNWELSYRRNSDGNRNTRDCAAPTHQMALKWLREIHGLNVQVCIVKTIELKKAYNATIYSNACEQLKAYFGRNIFDGFKSYEDAVEAAIKYCLTNLI